MQHLAKTFKTAGSKPIGEQSRGASPAAAGGDRGSVRFASNPRTS